MWTSGPRVMVWPAVVVFVGCAQAASDPSAIEQSLTTQFGNTAATSTLTAEGGIETTLTDRARALQIATLRWDAMHSARRFRYTDPKTHRVHDRTDLLTYDPQLEEMNVAIHDLWLLASGPAEHENLPTATIQFTEGTSRSWFTGNGNICTVLEDPYQQLLAASLYEAIPMEIRLRLGDDVASRDLDEFPAIRPDVQSMGMLLHELWLEQADLDDPAF